MLFDRSFRGDVMFLSCRVELFQVLRARLALIYVSFLKEIGLALLIDALLDEFVQRLSKQEIPYMFKKSRLLTKSAYL